MDKYEAFDYSETCSEIVKETRDVELAPGLNTAFDCLVESVQIFQDNIVEIVLQFRLQTYPDTLTDKYTFYTEQVHVIKDTYGAFYVTPWNDDTIELFTHIYIDGHKKFVEQFKLKLGAAANDIYKNEPVSYNGHIKKIASQLLMQYTQKL